MHISADAQRIILNASCVTISGRRTEQLDIIAGFEDGFISYSSCITGFMSGFISFIVVEHIRFFYGAL